MRIRIIAIVGTCAVGISACGSTGGRLPTQPRPPSPIALSVYVNDSRISVSPSSVGAGPVVFTVTNQASKAEALAISRSGGTTAIARTAPINPNGTTQVSVNFRPGVYTIATARGGTDAALSVQSSIRSALIRIGRERPSSSSELLQP
jgi:hypothetical protein